VKAYIYFRLINVSYAIYKLLN